MLPISLWSVLNFEFLVCRCNYSIGTEKTALPLGAEASVAGCWAKVSGTSAITMLCTRKQHNYAQLDNWW
jgi:hypothetical protein